MFELYKKKLTKAGTGVYEGCEDEVSLAGKNTGMVCRELRNMLKAKDNAPMGWNIPIADILSKAGYTLVMDMKPDNKEETLLCELDTIFGYSDEDGSTVMFRLKQLLNEDTEKDFDVYKFTVPKAAEVIVYSVNYMSGTISDGKLIGTWNFPARGANNNLLLSQTAMGYFFEQMKRMDVRIAE